MKERIRIGISACLLGERVRFDGGHKYDPFIIGTLGRYVDFVPVCPEVELGLPTPREALRLVGEKESPRLVFSKSEVDITDRMNAWSRRRVTELEREELCGFIFKSRSPSSGMERVKLYDRNGVPKKEGVGIFARIFMEHFPLVPVEEDGRLHDPILRENFIETLFTYQRWRRVAQGMKLKDLISFHTRHKLLLLSHSQEIYRQAGCLVAVGKGMSERDLYERYLSVLMKGLRLLPTRKKHTNVLQHAMGYFKTLLSGDEKEEMLEVIQAYSKGDIPLIVPVTLLNHYVRKYGQEYLKEQYYLNPHPLELRLRNHV